MNKKLVLVLGSIASVSLPISAVVSCGSEDKKETPAKVDETNKNDNNTDLDKKEQDKLSPLEIQISKLNQNNLSEIIKDNNKLPSQVTAQEILDKIKDSPNFKSLDKIYLNKLLLSDISIVYTNDSTGVLSVKILNHPKYIKISSVPGFKKQTYTLENVNDANAYKKLLESVINNINSTNSANDQIHYYESVDDKGKKHTLPIMASKPKDLDDFDERLLKFAFNDNKIYSISSNDQNKIIDSSKLLKSIFKIGYKNKNDNKFYLYLDKTKTGFDSPEKALAKYKENKITSNFINFIKGELSGIKKQYGLFGKPAITTKADQMIKDSNIGIGDNIINSLSQEQKTNLENIIKKYITADSNTNSSQIANIYEKDTSGKFMSGKNIISKGSGSFLSSFNVTGPDIKTKKGKPKKSNYGIVWGLLGSSKKNEIKFKEFQGFEKSIFPNFEKIAIIDAKTNAGSKNVSFVFLNINKKWLFSTDYINYIEGSKVPLTIKGIFKTNASEELLGKKGFQDLLDYTKASLAKSTDK